MRVVQIILAIAAIVVGLGFAIIGWWISSAAGRRIEYIFAIIHLWLGVVLVAAAIIALIRPKTAPALILAALLLVGALSITVWTKARSIFGDDAYSKAKDGDYRIPLE